MTTYTTEIAATLATIEANIAAQGIHGAEITYVPMSADAFWSMPEAADLVLDQLGLTPGEYTVSRGVTCVDDEGRHCERLRIRRA